MKGSLTEQVDKFALNQKIKEHRELTDLRWVCDCNHKNFEKRQYCGNCGIPRPRFS